jgi:outer membrane protein assembly factor BamB
MWNRRGLAVVAVTLLSTSLSGCWLQVGFNSGHTRFNDIEDRLTAANVGTLRQAWSRELLPSTSEPVVRGSRVYVTTSTNTDAGAEVDVRAFDIRTGDLAWDTNLSTVPVPVDFYVPVPVTFVGDELWAGYMLGQLPLQPRPIFRSAAPVRLDPDDGTVLGAEGALAMTPAVDAGAYVVVTRVLAPAEIQLEVRDKATGAIVWTAPLGRSMVPASEMLPAVADGQVYVVDDQQRLLEFALSGCGAPTCPPTWASTPAGALSSFSSYPVVAPGGRHLFIRGDGGALLAIDRVTHTVAWSALQASGGNNFTVAGEHVHVPIGAWYVTYAVEGCGSPTCTGSGLIPAGGQTTSAPVVAGDVIYFGLQGAVSAHSPGSSSPLVQLPVAGRVTAMSVAQGQLFVVHQPDASRSVLTAFALPT